MRVAQALADLAFVGLLVAASALDRRVERAPAAQEPLAAYGFRLRECASEHGIVFRHEPPSLDPRLESIAAHVAGLGAAVSACDVDGDGRIDLYATTSAFGRPNALFHNEGEGRFREMAAEAGLADLNRPEVGVSMGSIWADYDRDGDLDAFVYAWGRQRLLRNEGGLRFREVGEETGLARWMNANGATWIDFDRDGWIDLYVAGYFREDVDLWHLRDTRIMQNSFEFATNGGANHLWRNRGDGTFEEADERIPDATTRWTLAVAAADFDEDGWIDLYLANDYGPEELFLNREGRFELARGVGLDESSKSGMSVAVGDFLGEGHLGLFVTNISKRGFLFQGNNLRANRLVEKGRLYNLADAHPELLDCGWAWGARFGDLDNDGDQDLFVLNGFISADPDSDYWYRMSQIAGALGNVFEDARNWPPIEGRSLSGFERSRVLLNRPGKGFEEVAAQVGVEDRLDGRALVLADLFERGTLDVVIANQAGPLLVYANEVDPTRHWVQVELVGTRSDPCALGATVIARSGSERQAQVVDGGSGFCSQNPRRLHFGLGQATRLDELEIRWPSGARQLVRDLAADRVHRIVEDAR